MIAYPQIASITWREISADDADALAMLDRDCKRADGDEPVSTLMSDIMAVAAHVANDTLCGVRPDGQIAAVAWIKYDEVETATRATLGGRVHPDYRRRGLGSFLLEWAEDHAIRPGKATLFVIRNESLTADAQAIYTRRGFLQDFAENMMVRDLNQPISDAPFSDNVTTVPWAPDTMVQFFAAYRGSFADRPGFPDPPPEEWIGDHNAESDFRPDISTVAMAGEKPIGFVTCFVLTQLGWIGQIGVIPEWRKRGIADGLLVSVMRRFKAEGYSEAALHVNVNNPRATSVYERIGFVKRLQRARYVKKLTL
jgi:ribosomal protein S18 acetylase RimI-like enzyme